TSLSARNARSMRRELPRDNLSIVMPGLMPGVPLREALYSPKRDGRDKPGHDVAPAGADAMTSSPAFTDPRLASRDGFRVELDAGRERADIVLDRPPFNIVSMPQRDQLRLTFEALDEDARVRVIVLRAVGEHFSSGGNIKGFMEASPETV